MRTQRRFKQFLSLNDRLRLFSDRLKEQAAELRPGPERDALLRRANMADTATRIDEWTNSPGLQPPKSGILGERYVREGGVATASTCRRTSDR